MDETLHLFKELHRKIKELSDEQLSSEMSKFDGDDIKESLLFEYTKTFYIESIHVFLCSEVMTRTDEINHKKYDMMI